MGAGCGGGGGVERRAFEAKVLGRSGVVGRWGGLEEREVRGGRGVVVVANGLAVVLVMALVGAENGFVF